MYTVIQCILKVTVSPSLQMLQISSSPAKVGGGGGGAKPTKILSAPCPIYAYVYLLKGGAKYPSPPYSDINEYQCCEYSNLNNWKVLIPPPPPRSQSNSLDTKIPLLSNQ